MKNRTIAAAVAFAVVVFIGASAHARAWKRHKSARLGFSMLVPGGAKIVDRAWPGGWKGVQASHRGKKVVGVALLGKKKTAALIRALAEQISGMEYKHWTVQKTVKAKRGWFWYTTARAAHDGKVAIAVYGLGRRGTYLMLLLTTRADARRHRAAHARWIRGASITTAAMAGPRPPNASGFPCFRCPANEW